MTSRSPLTALVLAALTMLISATPAWADSRAEQFSRLPNWTGQWEIVGVTLDATGGIKESLQEVLGAMRKWGEPPYKPEVKPIFDQIANEISKLSAEDLKGGSDPTLTRPNCSFGFPAVMIQSPLMFEVLATPEETIMVFSGREVRHIYTDGRPHTPKDDLWPTLWGDSIGHWEGQTLVIDTIAVEMPPDVGGLPPLILAFGGDSNADVALLAMFSREVRFVERVHMIDKDHLEDRMTIIDTKVFSKPWTISRQYRRVTRMHRLVHEDCEGEDRNPIVAGRYTLTPPPPPPPPLPPPFQ
jgi:hypothetical protein